MKALHFLLLKHNHDNTFYQDINGESVSVLRNLTRDEYCHLSLILLFLLCPINTSTIVTKIPSLSESQWYVVLIVSIHDVIGLIILYIHVNISCNSG